MYRTITSYMVGFNYFCFYFILTFNLRPSEPVTNALIDPCYTPMNMSTEPLKYPNLVTGFERNPAHAARAALYTRYTALEWSQGNQYTFNEADTNRNYAERLRCDSVRLLRQLDEVTAQGQRETGRRLGERITDITFWRNEAHVELERMLAETKQLQDTKRTLDRAAQDLFEGCLHIAQECLYQREKRLGLDLVHDIVEVALLREVELLRDTQRKLKALLGKVDDQLKNNRAAQHELETDVKSKEGALGTDNLCHQLNNYSRGINYYGGIERYDPTVSNAESWSENSNRRVQMSQAERSKSAQMRSDIENMINSCAQTVWDCWSNTNNALGRRIAETLEAKSKLQMHLHKIQEEIFSIEKNMELIRKAIQDKSDFLKVAHTRLEARSHRLNIELCRDYAQDSLVKEVNTIMECVDKLHRKLQETEAQHQQLLMTRANLESDLQNKVNTLFIDREKCVGLRRSFPITSTIQY